MHLTCCNLSSSPSIYHFLSSCQSTDLGLLCLGRFSCATYCTIYTVKCFIRYFFFHPHVQLRFLNYDVMLRYFGISFLLIRTVRLLQLETALGGNRPSHFIFLVPPHQTQQVVGSCAICAPFSACGRGDSNVRSNPRAILLFPLWCELRGHPPRSKSPRLRGPSVKSGEKVKEKSSVEKNWERQKSLKASEIFISIRNGWKLFTNFK